MKINIVSKQIDVTAGIRDYAEKKMQRIEKYFDSSTLDVTITLTVQKDTQTAEVLIHSKGTYLKGLGRSEDLYASLDFATDKIERQVAKYKDRLNDRKQNAKPGKLHMNVYESASVDAKKPEILISKEIPADEMNVEEAVMQMELLNKDFFAFRNETGALSVVYRRDDGNIGLIEA
jgi:putative sigma-54 modulation protein